jgi:hypothetical protein
MSNDTQKQTAAPGGVLPAAALVALAGSLMAAAQAQASAHVAPEDRLDRTQPGGYFIGTDGKPHDAHGRVIGAEDPGSVGGLPGGVHPQALNQVTSEGELDALEKMIAARREALKVEKEAAQQRLDAEKQGASGAPLGSPANPGPASMSGGSSTSGEPKDYEEMDKEELARETERRQLTVKGTGANGSVLKADLVKALEKADKKAQE